MKRFTNILLICDDKSLHREAVERAVRLAKANRASVTLVDVVEAAAGELARLFGALPGARAHDVEFEVVEFHRSRVAEIAERFRAEGIPTTECILQGIPFVEIIRKVIRDRHDLVMKGAGGEADGASLIFASNDLHLLRKCPCPVWIMTPGPRPHYDRIMVAIDPDPADDRKHRLNVFTMELATSLSAIDDSELHVVSAWSLSEERTMRDAAFTKIPKAQIDLLVEEKRKLSETTLQALLQGFPDPDGGRQVHLLKGPARSVIPDFAEEKRVDLIVMGTVGRTGVSGLIIGNTAEAILTQVECSVLAVKPPGFTSPVRLDADAA